ncbi:hypothetical protein GMLC_30480 [Geomonas limicola]|uniref:Uncharacterized protein n=1 Tax=Geomonas limicola TaxID=2740186 RepID=A0A6V8NEC1_9BACT|nr:hypothetical protein [Geomonas limicola]GFO69469.1 hypothetical protein GMLC_30480 [Geomonas limicola]
MDDDKLKYMASSVAQNADIAEKLDKVLVGPNDRAYVMCSYTDCTLSSKGRCTIFTILDVPRMKTGQPCDRYESAVKVG